MEKTIEQRAQESLENRMEDLDFLYKKYADEKEDWDKETWQTAKDFEITTGMNEEEIDDRMMEARSNYTLSWDYVAPDTFNDQEQGYFQYQISWGGPSEEIRFYVDYGAKPYKVEWWFLDWFTGHGIELDGEYLEIAEAIFEDFNSMGMVESAYEQAMEE